MNFFDKIGDTIAPLARKLGENRYLSVLRDAFMLSFPLTMFGSIVVVINNLPFFNEQTKALLSNLFGNGQSATMSIMTVFVTFGIGYYLCRSYDVEGIFGGLAAPALKQKTHNKKRRPVQVGPPLFCPCGQAG